MWTTVKVGAGVAMAIVIFVCAVLVESRIRSRYGGPMSIDGVPVHNATVTGTWTPDFLWVGKAWKLEIQSDDDLELILDGKVYIIPKGSHSIYSNHDRTNTGQFGNQDFWGYPEKVEIRPLVRTP